MVEIVSRLIGLVIWRENEKLEDEAILKSAAVCGSHKIVGERLLSFVKQFYIQYSIYNANLVKQPRFNKITYSRKNIFIIP